MKKKIEQFILADIRETIRQEEDDIRRELLGFYLEFNPLMARMKAYSRDYALLYRRKSGKRG